MLEIVKRTANESVGVEVVVNVKAKSDMGLPQWMLYYMLFVLS